MDESVFYYALNLFTLSNYSGSIFMCLEASHIQLYSVIQVILIWT